ncbi:MAG: hypothetical protein HQL19_08830 [Candidatus Omnitrophica bacterium]|nr:hypothetical protein [Candidatus Omnitrophota bacterium]
MIQPKPQIISFLIADHIIQEGASHKWSVIGIFDRITAVKFPCLQQNLALYVKFCDAEGEYDVRVEFTDTQAHKLGAFGGIKLRVASRLEHPDFGVVTRSLAIPAPGKYNFDLYFNEQLVGSFPLEVLQAAAP